MAAYQDLQAHLDSQNIPYQAAEELQTAMGVVDTNHGSFPLSYSVDEIAAHVAGRLPTKVPQGARPAIAELTTRINCNLRIGAFKMDFDTGEIHFHASAPLVEDHLHEQIFWCLMMATVTMLDQFMPAILSVIYGNEEPAAALNQVMQAW